MSESDPPGGIADLRPLNRANEQRAWYFYDFANSAFATTIGGVLFGPYIKEIAEEAAVDNRIDVLFFSIAPGSLPPFIITFSTIISAVVLPLLGALADRTSRKKDLLAGFAWAGAASAALLFFVTGDNWQLGRSLSWSRTSASAPQRSSTTPCCRSSAPRTSATGCPAAAGRWGTPAAACCSPSTSC